MSKLQSDQEKFFLYNTLSVLLKAVEGERTTVDLRNEASVYGNIEQADGYMNIVMKDCIFTDPRGRKFPYDNFFVQARNIRYVHIPPKISIISAIKTQLSGLSGGQSKKAKKTFKSKRTQQIQLEGVAATDRILKERLADAESNVIAENEETPEASDDRS